MSRSIYLLYSSYGLELSILLGSCVYVFYCIIARHYYMNDYLKGRRLVVAFFVPFVWIYYAGTDCYHTTSYLSSFNWSIPEVALWDKAIRQMASCIGTILTTTLITGYKFGEK